MPKKSQKQKFSDIECLVKNNLRTARIYANMSIAEAAERLGVKPKKIQDIETHRNYGVYVRVTDLERLSEIYERPISFFFDKNVKKVPPRWKLF